MEPPDLVVDASTAAVPSTDLKLDLLANHLKVVSVDQTETREEVRIEEESEEDRSASSETRTHRAPPPSPALPSSSDRFRKVELLRIFHELEQKGVVMSKSYTIQSPLEEMEEEYDILKSLQAKRQAIRLYKGFMLNAVQAIEFLNESYNPFDFYLKGWSENISLQADDYDDVFGELYEKYKHTGRKLEPELKLVLMIVMSATTFHARNTILKTFDFAPPPPPKQPEAEKTPPMRGPDPRAYLAKLRRTTAAPPPPPVSTREPVIVEEELSTDSSSMLSSSVVTSRRRKKPMTIDIS